MSDKLVTYDLLHDDLMARREVFAGVLPQLFTLERFLNFSLLCLRETPQLYHCTRQSIMAGIYQAAKDGLELGRDCYLVPFKDEAVYIRHFQGLVKLLERTGLVRKAFAEIVYEHDVFDLDYGAPLKPLTHKPARTQRGKPLGAYGAIVMKDDTWHVHYMTKDDLERVRQQAPGREQDTWIKNWTEMARKSAFKNTCKYVPLIPEVHDALTQEETGEPAPVGAERAREIVGETFDRSEGRPEEVTHAS